MLNHPLLPKQLSAGIVIVHFDSERYRLLALRNFNSWDFPNLPVEEGDDPLQTALRAGRESTGLDELELDWGDASRETVPFEDGSVTRYYIARSKSDDVQLDVPPGEGSEDFEYRWVTAEEAEDVLPPRLALILDWALRQLASKT